eukprot:618714-Amphidinium_carterae.1
MAVPTNSAPKISWLVCQELTQFLELHVCAVSSKYEHGALDTAEENDSPPAADRAPEPGYVHKTITMGVPKPLLVHYE